MRWLLLVTLVSCAAGVAPDAHLPDAATEDGGADAGPELADAGPDAGCVSPAAEEACAALPCGHHVGHDRCGRAVSLDCSCEDGGADTETFEAPDAGIADAGPVDEHGVACFYDGYDCQRDDECCSGACSGARNGVCVCTSAGGTCWDDGDCCAGGCIAHLCTR